MSSQQYYVYILTNFTNSVLYTGVTGNLIKRVWEHKNKVNINSFTAKYHVMKLVYFEIFQTSYEAISREKQIKADSRKKKIALIEKENADWQDLYKNLI